MSMEKGNSVKLVPWSAYLKPEMSQRLEQMAIIRNLSKSAVVELMISRGMAITEEREKIDIAVWGES